MVEHKGLLIIAIDADDTRTIHSARLAIAPSPQFSLLDNGDG
jgi:hypothetical protein